MVRYGLQSDNLIAMRYNDINGFEMNAIWRKGLPSVKLQDALQHIPEGSAHDMAIRVSGIVGGSTAFAGLSAESTISEWTELSQIVANFGIGLSSIVAFFALCYSIYKGTKKKPDA